MKTLKEMLGFSGKAWIKRMTESINDDVNSSIRIKDEVVNGKSVIALVVNNVVVEYVGKADSTLDPDGYPLQGSPTQLIERMEELRNNEIERRMRKYGVYEEIAKQNNN